MGKGQLGNKFISLQEAVAKIESGSSITFSGFGHTLTPMAFVREMIRQQKKELHLIGIGEAWAVDSLAGAGALSKVWLSNFMFEGYGRCRNFSQEVEKGEIEIEDCSHFGQISRFQAGATGVPFLPIRSMLGTDIEKLSTKPEKTKRVECPFTGETLLAVPAIKPDFAVIHASRADHLGNIQIFGHSTSIDEQARSAKRIIVTVEEVVSHEEIARCPELTLIPGLMVDFVVEVPYGAHPTGMYKYYSEDKKHIDEYMNACKTKEAFQSYLDKYVFGAEDHWDYLNKIGMSQLFALKADPHFGYKLPESL